jgi:hypothetical protein
MTRDPHWEGVCDLGPSPQPGRKFKWAALFGPIIHHPSWTTPEYISAVKAEIDCAFDKGYRVVIPATTWEESGAGFVDQMTTLNHKALGGPLHALLHSYSGTLLGGDPDRYYELKRP